MALLNWSAENVLQYLQSSDHLPKQVAADTTGTKPPIAKFLRSPHRKVKPVKIVSSGYDLSPRQFHSFLLRMFG